MESSVREVKIVVSLRIVYTEDVCFLALDPNVQFYYYSTNESILFISFTVWILTRIPLYLSGCNQSALWVACCFMVLQIFSGNIISLMSSMSISLLFRFFLQIFLWLRQFLWQESTCISLENFSSHWFLFWKELFHCLTTLSFWGVVCFSITQGDLMYSMKDALNLSNIMLTWFSIIMDKYCFVFEFSFLLSLYVLTGLLQQCKSLNFSSK